MYSADRRWHFKLLTKLSPAIWICRVRRRGTDTELTISPHWTSQAVYICKINTTKSKRFENSSCYQSIHASIHFCTIHLSLTTPFVFGCMSFWLSLCLSLPVSMFVSLSVYLSFCLWPSLSLTQMNGYIWHYLWCPHKYFAHPFRYMYYA